MSPLLRKILIVLAAAGLVVGAIAAGLWWLQRGGPVVQRTELVGPETQAFVTFIAASEDHAIRDLIATLERRAGMKREGQPEWVHMLADFLSASHDAIGPASLFPLRGTAMVEKRDEDSDGQLVLVLSLGRHVNLVRMFLGVSDSERERETYKGEKILIARGGRELSMALVKNNLLLSADTGALKLLIDRMKSTQGTSRPAERLGKCIQGVDPGAEMAGFGGMINDRRAIATIWQLGTGAPEGSEIALPDEFEGAGFRFGVSTADAVKGDGYFYFADEEAAAGAVEELRSGLERLFTHYGLTSRIAIRQEGSRLAVSVEANGVQPALDRLFVRLQTPPAAATSR